jgi:hypothetical protein
LAVGRAAFDGGANFHVRLVFWGAANLAVSEGKPSGGHVAEVRDYQKRPRWQVPFGDF